MPPILKNNIRVFSSQKYSKLDVIHSLLENSSNQPKYLVDLTELVQQFQTWTDNLPNITPYYAVKCNPNPVMIQVLDMLGCGFDCASKNEIVQVLSYNIPADNIIYANPVKDPEYIKFALRQNVNMMTFDCESELRKIKESHPTAKLVLRIKTDDSKSIHKFSVKFGCSMNDVSSVLRTAHELELDVIGVSFHVGSKCNNPESYSDAIHNAREVFRKGERLGFNMNFLDIGGGFPGCSKDSKATFEEMAVAIKKAIEENFSDVEDLKIIAEPGRYFATKTHTLAFNVIGKKESELENGSKHMTYYMNDGIYGSFNCIKFDDADPEIIPIKERETKHCATMFGPTCDSIDTIFKMKEFPDLEIGEWCYVEQFGAYTASASSAFNGFNEIEVVYFIRMDAIEN